MHNTSEGNSPVSEEPRPELDEEQLSADERLLKVKGWADGLVNGLVAAVERAHRRALQADPTISETEWEDATLRSLTRACNANADTKLHASVVNAAAILALWKIASALGAADPDTPVPVDAEPVDLDSDVQILSCEHGTMAWSPKKKQ